MAPNRLKSPNGENPSLNMQKDQEYWARVPGQVHRQYPKRALQAGKQLILARKCHQTQTF